MVRSVVRSAIRSVVRSAIRSVVRSVVRSAIRSAVRSAVRSVVRSVIRSRFCRRRNALKLITFIKGRPNFNYKSTTAANVDLTESLNWLKNNLITVDKIYYLRSLSVFFCEI